LGGTDTRYKSLGKATMSLASIGLTVPLSDLYKGIDVPDAAILTSA